MAFQPLKTTLINKDGQSQYTELYIKEEEPFLFTCDDEPVQMYVENNILKFKLNDEEYKSAELVNKTAQERFDFINDVIQIRVDILKKVRKRKEREDEQKRKIEEYKKSASAIVGQ